MKGFNMMNAVLLAAFVSGSVHATSINPGDTNVSLGSTNLGALGTLTLVTDTSSSYSVSGGGKFVSGTLESAVYKTTGGTLDFFYQITQNKNTGSPKDTIPTDHLYAPIDDSFLGVDAYYISPVPSPLPANFSEFTTPPGIVTTPSPCTSKAPCLDGTPTTISRPGAGDGVVQFGLKNMPAASSTTVSTLFVLTTNEELYQKDIAQIGGGVLATNPATFSPAPEPGFYGLLATGLAGLFWFASRRTRRPASSNN